MENIKWSVAPYLSDFVWVGGERHRISYKMPRMCPICLTSFIVHLLASKEDIAYIEDRNLWTTKEVREIGHSAWHLEDISLPLPLSRPRQNHRV